MSDIRIGRELNTFYINTKRVNSVMVNQHMCINANFEDINLFIKTINHEHLHEILNTVVDNTCNISLMLDNIDTYECGYPVSW